jgi:hypothetical protein
MYFLTPIRVIIVAAMTILQLGLVALLVLDAVVLRVDPPRERWLVFVPHVFYSIACVPAGAWRATSTWRGLVHGLVLAYIVAAPALAWTLALALCRGGGDETLYLLTQHRIETFAQQLAFVGGTYVLTSTARAVSECAYAHMHASDVALALLAASSSTSTATAARRRRRQPELDVEMDTFTGEQLESESPARNK